MTRNLPTLAPQNMTEAMEFSKMISASGMVPSAYKGKPQDVLVAIQWGYELGLQPLQALQNIAVINGKPSVYGDAALALVKNDPRCAGVSEVVQGEGDERVAICTVKRRYGDEIEETSRAFSVLDAKRARLWGKQGPWTQYPDRMLSMRARGFALRDAFPDALKGVITVEEAQDYPSAEPRHVESQPVNPLDAVQAPVEASTEPEVQSTSEPSETAVRPNMEPSEQVEVIEVVETEAIEATPAEPEGDWQFCLLTHKGFAHGEPSRYAPDFVTAMSKMIQIYARAKEDAAGNKVKPRDKMTMLKQLREANQPNLDRLNDEQQAQISDLYTKELRRLGAEMNGGENV